GVDVLSRSVLDRTVGVFRVAASAAVNGTALQDEESTIGQAVAGLVGVVAELNVVDERGDRLRGGGSIKLDAESDVVEYEFTGPGSCLGKRRVRNRFRVRPLILWIDWRVHRLCGCRCGLAWADREVEHLGEGREGDHQDGDDDPDDVVAEAPANLVSVNGLPGVVAAKAVASRPCIAISSLARCHVSSSAHGYRARKGRPKDFSRPRGAR